MSIPSLPRGSIIYPRWRNDLIVSAQASRAILNKDFDYPSHKYVYVFWLDHARVDHLHGAVYKPGGFDRYKGPVFDDPQIGMYLEWVADAQGSFPANISGFVHRIRGSNVGWIPVSSSMTDTSHPLAKRGVNFILLPPTPEQVLRFIQNTEKVDQFRRLTGIINVYKKLNSFGVWSPLEHNSPARAPDQSTADDSEGTRLTEFLFGNMGKPSGCIGCVTIPLEDCPIHS